MEQKTNFTIGTYDSSADLEQVDNNVAVGFGEELFVIAGPCVIESEKLCYDIAARLMEISKNTDIGIIFKASFDKANRSSIESFRGPGMEAGLHILANVRQKYSMPVLTDVHLPGQAERAASVVDCLQIPAFLCRQTDLICACAETGRVLNIKKGQFMSPQEMQNVVDKAHQCSNTRIMLTERGTFFGYNRLVNDMTSIQIMSMTGSPVVFDATHSTQQPGGAGKQSAGNPQMAPILAKAAVAAGANGLFFEVHPDPANAKSDAASIMHINRLEKVLTDCKKIFDIIHG